MSMALAKCWAAPAASPSAKASYRRVPEPGDNFSRAEFCRGPHQELRCVLAVRCEALVREERRDPLRR
jgi:hypothetical protein